MKYMTTKLNNVLILVLFLGLLVISASLLPMNSAMAEEQICDMDADEFKGPIVHTQKPSTVTSKEAVFNAYFTPRDACYTDMDRPYVVFEYGETSSMSRQTKAIDVRRSASMISVNADELDPDESYYYRAVLYNEGSIQKSDIVKFDTEQEENNTGNGDENNLSVSESSRIIDATDNDDAGGATNTNGGQPSGETTDTSTNQIRRTNTDGQSRNIDLDGRRIERQAQFQELEEGDAIDVSIGNDVDTLRQNNEVTYRVNIQNISNQEIEDVVLVVNLPSMVNYEASNRGSYRNARDGVLVTMGDLDVDKEETVTVRGSVTRSNKDRALAAATATYTDDEGSTRLKKEGFDIDRYVRNQSNLAAGLFSADFLPTSILGWLVVAAILVAIIYLVRAHFMRHYWTTHQPVQPYDTGSQEIGNDPTERNHTS